MRKVFRRVKEVKKGFSSRPGERWERDSRKEVES